MDVRVVPYDGDNKKFQFNISNISKESWKTFVLDILIARLPETKGVTLIDNYVEIRDNVAKVQICWQDKFYHEFKFHLDEFGRKSKEYSDIVSEIWQNVMTDYYQEEYVDALDAKLSEVKLQTK